MISRSRDILSMEFLSKVVFDSDSQKLVEPNDFCLECLS